MLSRSGNEGGKLRFLLSLRLKHTFEKLRERRFIFGAARIELQRTTDVRRLVHYLSPEVHRPLLVKLNLEPDEFLDFNRAAGEHKAAAATQIRDGGVLTRHHAFPASCELDSRTWRRSSFFLHYLPRVSVQTDNRCRHASCRDGCVLPTLRERIFCRAWFSDSRCLRSRRCRASRRPCVPPS